MDAPSYEQLLRENQHAKPGRSPKANPKGSRKSRAARKASGTATMPIASRCRPNASMKPSTRHAMSRLRRRCRLRSSRSAITDRDPTPAHRPRIQDPLRPLQKMRQASTWPTFVANVRRHQRRAKPTRCRRVGHHRLPQQACRHVSRQNRRHFRQSLWHHANARRLCSGRDARRQNPPTRL